MQINSLKIRNFKNHGSVDLDFSERVSVFAGNNGSGKTNLLDALHHVSLLRSAFHREDALNIHFEEPFYRLEAGLSEAEKTYRLTILLERNARKQISWNGKALESNSAHLGKFPLVLILPDEPFQMNESADWRRSIIDNVLCQSFPEYAAHLSRFKRILNQRNALLRYFAEGRRYDADLLDALDEDLARESSAVFSLRCLHFPALNSLLLEEYRYLSSGREDVEIRYESQLEQIPATDLLRSRRQQDLEAGRSTAGIQRDDYAYLINGKSLKKFASQGQQKTWLLAMKFACYRFLSEQLNKPPCLLLDDVFDKLDEERIGSLIRRISEKDIGQVFITDAREERSRSLLQGFSCEIFTMEKLRS